MTIATKTEGTNTEQTIPSNNATTDKKEELDSTKDEKNSGVEKSIERDQKEQMEKEELAVYSDHGLNLNEDLKDDEILVKEGSNLICPYEIGVITFTKLGLCNENDNKHICLIYFTNKLCISKNKFISIIWI